MRLQFLNLQRLFTVSNCDLYEKRQTVASEMLLDWDICRQLNRDRALTIAIKYKEDYMPYKWSEQK